MRTVPQTQARARPLPQPSSAVQAKQPARPQRVEPQPRQHHGGDQQDDPHLISSIVAVVHRVSSSGDMKGVQQALFELASCK